MSVASQIGLVSALDVDQEWLLPAYATAARNANQPEETRRSDRLVG